MGINWQQSHLNGNFMNLLAMVSSAPPLCLDPEARDASVPSQSGAVALGSTASSLQRPSSSFSVRPERQESEGPQRLWPQWPTLPVPAGSLQGQHEYVDVKLTSTTHQSASVSKVCEIPTGSCVFCPLDCRQISLACVLFYYKVMLC